MAETMNTLNAVKQLLGDTLQLGDRIQSFTGQTPLFGSLPEFDSMAVLRVIVAIEDQFDLEVEDDEITAEVFETVGSLATFVENKLNP